jgi:polycomb protein EED
MYSLPIIATEHPNVPVSPKLHVYQSPYNDPLLLFVMLKSDKIQMMNVVHLAARKPPPFPIDDEVTEMTKRMRLADDDDEGDDLKDFFRGHTDLPFIGGWDIDAGIRTGDTDPNFKKDDIEACAMGMDGRVIVGVGSAGTIWVWINKEPVPLPG